MEVRELGYEVGCLRCSDIDEDGLEYSDDQKVAWFSFRCWTAWGPPVPVWDRLHAMGIEVEADYQDEGEMFEGAYHQWRGQVHGNQKRRLCDE